MLRCNPGPLLGENEKGSFFVCATFWTQLMWLSVSLKRALHYYSCNLEYLAALGGNSKELMNHRNGFLMQLQNGTAF